MFGPVVKEKISAKDISILSSGGQFVQCSRSVCAILVHEEGIMRNISVKLYSVNAIFQDYEVVLQSLVEFKVHMPNPVGW